VSFPRYPEYRDSGLEWLGQVPAHWEVMPIRRAAKLESGHTPSRSRPEYWQDCTVPWFSLADVWQIREQGADVIYETKEKVSEVGLANSSARLLPKGTVMLSRTASVGFSAIMGVDMATTQDFANWVCGPTLRPQFLLQVFRSMRSEFRRMMMGSTHNTIYMPDIQTLRLALPPVVEQAAIVEFLDRETAKIDALVAEQQRLVELLKEKRQAVISHAVTKGLNPDAPMKSSGVEWLGEVPEHWRVGKCGFHAKVLAGFAFPSEGFSDEPSHVRLLRGMNVAVGTLRWNDVVYWRREHEDGLSEFELQEGQIVVGMDRPLIADGVRVARVQAKDLPCLLLQRVAAIDVCDGLHAGFLENLLASPMFVAHFDPQTTGVSVPHISPQQIRDFLIPVPPMDEQVQIAQRLRVFLRDSDTLIAEAQRAITLLQERRAALISAAVTGQIDVRGLASSEVA